MAYYCYFSFGGNIDFPDFPPPKKKSFITSTTEKAKNVLPHSCSHLGKAGRGEQSKGETTLSRPRLEVDGNHVVPATDQHE